MAQRIQAALPQSSFGLYARLAAEFAFEEQVGNSTVVREPVGVVAAHHALELSAAPDRRQGGAGARGRLHGGAQAQRGGTAQRLHPGRDRRCRGPAGRRVQPDQRHRSVGRRGAGAAPRGGHGFVYRLDSRRAARISELAAGTVKRVALELGGKSASVVLDDADLATAIKTSVSVVLSQLRPDLQCADPPAGARDALRGGRALAVETAETFTVGDPLQARPSSGPVVSAAQRERVRCYIRKGVRGGRGAACRRSGRAGGPGAGATTSSPPCSGA